MSADLHLCYYNLRSVHCIITACLLCYCYFLCVTTDCWLRSASTQTLTAMVDTCPWPCMVSPAPEKPSSAANRSFAQALNDACDVTISQLLVPAIRGEDLCIKITQHEYEKGLADRKKNLHGRLVMNKGDRSLTARELS
ncbi:NBS resistance protein, partial [Trifolium medium]|nr:NBS resistance protein [Trifolium medium]